MKKLINFIVLLFTIYSSYHYLKTYINFVYEFDRQGNIAKVSFYNSKDGVYSKLTRDNAEKGI